MGNYKATSIDDIWPEISALFKDYADEVLGIPEKLAPSKERYEAMQAAGLLHVFEYRLTSGELAGWATFFITRHAHVDAVVATQDSLYVKREHRGLGAMKFMAWCDAKVGEMGAKYVIRQVTPGCDYSALLQNMGYRVLEMAFIKKVGE